MSSNFKYSGFAHIPLTPVQKTVLQKLKDKIESGVYGFEDVKCLCGSSKSQLVSETDRYGLKLSIVICSDCGLVRMNPRPDAASLENFYRLEYRDLYMGPEYGSMDNYFQGMIARGESILSLIDSCSSEVSWQAAKVLEVGCSAGGILVPFLRRGASVRGYDYDPRYLNYGKSKFPKLDLKAGGVSELSSDRGIYDLIIFNHVLEHLADPRQAFKLAESRLSEKGMIYVSVPGLRNPEFYFSPSKSILGGFHIAHLFYFTALTLKQATSGFKTLFIDESVRGLLLKQEIGSKPQEAKIASECSLTLEYIQRYESRVLGRYFVAAAHALRGSLGRLISGTVKLLKRIKGALKNRLFSLVEACKCLNREYRWLYQNRYLRMDANLELGDKSRRDFHIDRYKFAAEFLSKNLGPDSSVLDAACGTGYGSDILKQCRPARLLGVDICPQTVEYARKTYRQDGCDFLCGDVTRFEGVESQSFDAAVSFETIEHLDQPVAFLEKLHSLLKPGGVLIISTPNKWGITKYHKVDYDYEGFKKDLERFFRIEKIFVQNSGTMSLSVNRGAGRRLVPDEPGIRDSAECFIAVAYKEKSKIRI